MNIPRFLFFLGLFMLGIFGKAQQPTEAVKVYLGWTHQFQFAGYYMAKEMGYYDALGVRVELIPYDCTLGAKSILAGKYEYGIASAGQLIGSEFRDQLTVVTPIFQRSPLSLLVKRGDGIEILKDLEGRSIGSGNEIKAMLHLSGVNLDSIKFGRDTSLEQDLISGEFDGITHYVTDYLENPKEYIMFRPIEYGINFYGDCLYTTKEELNSNSTRVESMREATLRGWKFAMTNPEKTINTILEKYNSGLSREQLRREASVVINSQILSAFYPLGYNDIEKWRHVDKTLSEFIAHEKPLDLESFIYTPDSGESSEQTRRLILFGGWGLMVFGLLAVGLLFYNRQLKKAVKIRTKEVERKHDLVIKQKQELESLNGFKDKMLSVISHDVRGPIGSIKGLFNLASGGHMSPDEFQKFSKIGATKVDEIDGLLENLITWFKDQITIADFKIEPIDLTPIIEDCVQLLNLNAAEKSVSIKNLENTPTMVLGNQETLKIVIRNLLSNAVKFCSKDDTVTLETEINEDWIFCRISDTGKGMDEDKLKQLFKPNITSTRGTKGEAGTGLGLMLCKEFVEKNGGEIGAESRLGEGSTFWFKLKSA